MALGIRTREVPVNLLPVHKLNGLNLPQLHKAIKDLFFKRRDDEFLGSAKPLEEARLVYSPLRCLVSRAYDRLMAYYRTASYPSSKRHFPLKTPNGEVDYVAPKLVLPKNGILRVDTVELAIGRNPHLLDGALGLAGTNYTSSIVRDGERDRERHLAVIISRAGGVAYVRFSPPEYFCEPTYDEATAIAQIGYQVDQFTKLSGMDLRWLKFLRWRDQKVLQAYKNSRGLVANWMRNLRAED